MLRYNVFLGVVLFVAIILCAGCATPYNKPPAAPSPLQSPVTIPDIVSPTPPAPPPTEKDMPAVVFSIAALDAEGKYNAFANAVLIDKERELFVANAHIVAEGVAFKIFMNGSWREVINKPQWLHWNEDVAFFKTKTPIKTLPAPAPLFLNPSRGTPVFVKGRFIRATKLIIKEIVPHVATCSIIKTGAGWDITVMSRLDVLVARLRKMLKDPIHDRELHLLYQNYIILEAAEGDEAQKACTFKEGISGSPVLTKEGKFIGIVSGITDYQGIIVPASEIKRHFDLMT